ncbi:MAG: hypothetical protein E7233_00965 [Lachnospiraceae bacterium]|nr:hypothetical protein [Lachnospiraceae bacterium]
MEKIVNEMIEEISRINSAAADYVESAENAKIKLGRDYRAKKEEFDEKLNDSAQARLDELKEKLTRENNDRIDALHRETDEYIMALESSFEQNHSEWAQKIVDEITAQRL